MAPKTDKTRSRAFAAGVALLCLSLLTACISSGPRPERARRVDPGISRDVPTVFRNTIGASAGLSNIQPLLCSGFGLVVDLNGTGSSDVPQAVRAELEREMLLLGVGKENTPFARTNPDDLLNSKNTAVVVVYGVIPPGSKPGKRIDVFVQALPGTSTNSLEGGRLYTTELTPGQVTANAPYTPPIARASGDLFINPFSTPGSAAGIRGTRTVGRVLNGGLVLKTEPPVLALDVPSHSRARTIVNAINTRFPQRGQETADGRSDEIIELSVPREYLDRPSDFFSIIEHLRMDNRAPEDAAVRYVRELQDTPRLSEELSWALQGLGEVAVPQVQTIYGHPELAPRLAALQTGARLGDATVRVHLEELVETGTPRLRVNCVRLLGQLPPDTRVNRFLRDQLDSPHVDVRIAAYDALLERADPVVRRDRIDEKFTLHLVPSSEPMVYVTLQGEPRIVLFGSDVELERPTLVRIWDDRLMLSAESTSDRVGVFYQDYRTGETTTAQLRPGLLELVRYLGHETTPENPAPGLALTYSEVVGALHDVLEQGAAVAAFVPETDQLALEVLRQQQSDILLDRPELMDTGEPKPPSEEDLFIQPVEPAPEAQGDPEGAPQERDYIIRLRPVPNSDDDN